VLKTPVTEVNEADLWRRPTKDGPPGIPRHRPQSAKNAVSSPASSIDLNFVPIFEFLLPKPARLSSKSAVIKVIPGNRGLK
jgi:hypothetical protein